MIVFTRRLWGLAALAVAVLSATAAWAERAKAKGLTDPLAVLEEPRGEVAAQEAQAK
jgi:hypothetical protein